MTSSRPLFATLALCAVLLLLALGGCGKPTLETIDVEPATATVTVGQTLQLRAVGRDTKGNPMADLTFTWSVRGEAGRIDANGLFTALKPGTVTVIASANEVQGTATITVEREKVAKLEATPAAAQVAAGGQTQLTVMVQGASGKGIAEVAVQAQALTEGTRVEPATATTDATGKAVFTLTAAPAVTTNRVQVRADDQQATVEVQGIPGAPARLSLQAEATQVIAGEATSVRVQVQDAHGNPVPNVALRFAALTAGTAVTPAEATTDAQGQATATLRTSPQAGPNRVQVRADGQQATVEVQGIPGAPAQLSLQAEATQVIAGEATSVRVQVQDAHGNPVPNVALRFAALTAGTAVTPAEATTDAQGQATATLRTSPQAGPNRVQVRADDQQATVEVQGIPGAPAQLSLQAEATETIAGGTVTLTVTVRDAHGNPVPNVPIALRVSPMEAALEQASLTSDAEGRAQTVLRTSPQAGENTAEARVAELAPVTLTVVGHPPVALQVLPQTATVEMRGTQRFRAVASDAYGHTLEVTPRWNVVGETGTIAADGTFTATALGSDVLIATYAGLIAGANLTVVPGAVATLKVTPAEATIVSGTTQQFQAEAFNAHGYPLEVTPVWEVTNGVGTIDASGLFTATKAGKGEVLASAAGQTGRATVTVIPGELVRIAVEPARVAVKAGEEVQLQATGYDAAGNPVPIEPLWRLTASLGELTPDGRFRARHAGQGHILVEAGPQPIVVEVPVTVTAAALERVEVEPATLTLSAGEAYQFTAVGYDAFGNPIAVTPTWRLTAEVGSIDEQGRLTARRAGSAQVVAKVDALEGTASLTVKPAALASLTIDPAGPLTLAAGEVLTLKAIGRDAYGNVVAVQPTWRQTAPLGTLSASGQFRAEKVGSGELVAESGALRAAVHVTVTPGKLAKIVVFPTMVTLQAGETLPFQATGLDAYGNEVAIQPSWRVTNDLGEISPEGVLTAVQARSGEVIATAAGVSGSAQVTVAPGPLTFLQVTPESLTLTAGDTAQLVVVGYDAFGNPVPITPVWHVTEGMGTVSPEGLFTAKKAGKGRIVVAVGHLAAVIPLQIERGEVAALRIEPAAAQVASGEQQAFSVVGLDRGGNAVPVEATWDVQGDIGTIDAQGRFTATVAGSGTVIAKVGTLTATAQVTVVPGAVARLEVSPESATLVAGETLTLHAEAFDAAGNRVPVAPTWQVENDLGTVADGVFQARRAGSGKIIAAVGEVQATIEVRVKPGALAALTVQPSRLLISAGGKMAFAVNGYDAFGNAVAVPAVRWSLQGTVGEIDPERGVFQATTVGEGHVVAVAGSVAGLAAVTVEPGAVARLQLAPSQATVRAGEEVAFTATAFDALGNVTAAEVRWQLSTPLGELVNGTLRAHRAGTAQVIARAGDVEARATVQVVPGPVVRLEVSPSWVQLPAGGKVRFHAFGYDAFGNSRQVPATWTLDGAVGTLDAEGTFVAGPQGTGTVTARFQTHTGTAQVEVIPGPVQRLVVTPARADVAATVAVPFSVIGFDAGGNRQEVTAHWALTPGVGTLDQRGRFVATHVGTGTVVAYTDALLATAEVAVKPGPVALVFVTPQPATVHSGESLQFEAKGFDVYRNLISPLPARWHVEGDIGTIDPRTGRFTATVVGLGKVIATVDDKSGSADVTVVHGKPDAGKSRLMASRVQLLADGKTAADIIVLVRDRHGNPVAKAQVTLVSSRGDDIEQPAPSNEQGIAIGRIRSRTPGISEISAVIDAVRVHNTLRLTFTQIGASG
ncbi:MAG: hypothetical protein KatS3mg131_1722 [Candidatus Tectimicrobiota bacterium]|nr:MAG: hypothetical protein KatS3mg131_1722 [Candidatus Tectomicrobia bacterium]